MKRPSLFDPVFLLMAIGLLVADQTTKVAIQAALGPDAPRHSIEVLGDWVRLSYTTNTGAAFGIGQNRSIIFTLVALAAIPALLFFNRSITPRTLITRICLGALLGGTIGNLTDRLRLGYVVDFVDVGIGDLRWPSFNVADSSFVVGIIILSIFLFVTDPGRQSNGETDPKPDRRYA